MVFEVRLHPEVVKFLRSLDKKKRDKIKDSLRILGEDPFTKRPKADIKKLKGTRGRRDLYRVRIARHRVIYSVEDNIVWVTDIFIRSKGYKSGYRPKK
jgi:mRNA interferase RelE/StbE